MLTKNFFRGTLLQKAICRTQLSLLEKQSRKTNPAISTLQSFSTRYSSSDMSPDLATIVQGPSLLTNTNVHRPSPSMFFLPGLRSLPFWTSPPALDGQQDPSKVSVAYGDPTITRVVKHLEQNYETIKEEYMSAVMGTGRTTDMSTDNPSVSKPLEPDYDVNKVGGEHASDKLHAGCWDWHSYVLNGIQQPKFVEACPKTVDILAEVQDTLFYQDASTSSDRYNPFGFTFFSTLHGKSYIKPHTGPMNLRLRIHLPLIVPKNTEPDAFSSKPQTKCGIRVGNQIRSWKEGKAVVLDDSYEHEVWNETDDFRVILLIDVWHPDVRTEERIRIGKMFHYAMKQGWMGKDSN